MNEGTLIRQKVLSKLKDTNFAKAKLTCSNNFLKQCKNNFQQAWSENVDCSSKASITKYDQIYISTLRRNKILLDEEVHQIVNESIKNKINIQNVSTFHQLSSIFTSPNLLITTISYIERLFSIVSETTNFFELDYKLFVKIVQSSNLNVSLELVVCKAANAWISHNKGERLRFAHQILSNIRIPLIVDHELRSLLSDNSSFSERQECVDLLESYLNNKDNYIRNAVGLGCTNRYYEQNLYEILFIGGSKSQNKLENSNQIHGECFSSARKIHAPSIHHRFNTVSLKGDLYAFLDYSESVGYVARYSEDNNCWEKVADMSAIRMFCCCAYLDKVVVLGGRNINGSRRDSCLQFDTRSCEWSEIQKMNRTRVAAACAIFRGEIIVAGGMERSSVESFNGVEWSPMARMNGERYCHSLLVVRNSLYVVGCFLDSCEVYDDVSRSFIVLKTPSKVYYNTRTAFCVGSKIVAIQGNASYVVCYDVDTGEWTTEKWFDTTSGYGQFYYAKVPLM